MREILVCKNCGEELKDVENRSGSVTVHLKKCTPTLTIPTKLFRTNFLKKNGEYWHFQFFNKITIESIETVKCPECEWTTTDLTNKSGQFTLHVTKTHGIIDDFITRNPSMSKMFSKYISHKKRQQHLNEEGNSVECKICGQKLKSINNTHLKKHNLTLTDYKLQYGSKDYVSKMTKVNTNVISEPGESTDRMDEIISSITRYGYEIKVTQNRITVPKLNVAIEFNGVYYHTEEKGKYRNYHIQKTKVCDEVGISLYHIFEDEWVYNKNLCLSKIRYILESRDLKVYHGRKIVVKPINSEVLKEFLEQNHMCWGSVLNRTVSYGGFIDGKLVNVMSFNKKGDTTWELTRYCQLVGTRVNGGAGKLLQHFIRKNGPTKVITYADRRWSPDKEKNMYITLGFKLVGETKPTYTYVNFKIDRYKRFHKFNFRKERLLKKHPELLNETMSESEMVMILGYEKIWDCGLFKYELTI